MRTNGYHKDIIAQPSAVNEGLSRRRGDHYVGSSHRLVGVFKYPDRLPRMRVPRLSRG